MNVSVEFFVKNIWLKLIKITFFTEQHMLIIKQSVNKMKWLCILLVLL